MEVELYYPQDLPIPVNTFQPKIHKSKVTVEPEKQPDVDLGAEKEEDMIIDLDAGIDATPLDAVDDHDGIAVGDDVEIAMAEYRDLERGGLPSPRYVGGKRRHRTPIAINRDSSPVVQVSNIGDRDANLVNTNYDTLVQLIRRLAQLLGISPDTMIHENSNENRPVMRQNVILLRDQIDENPSLYMGKLLDYIGLPNYNINERYLHDLINATVTPPGSKELLNTSGSTVDMFVTILGEKPVKQLFSKYEYNFARFRAVGDVLVRARKNADTVSDNREIYMARCRVLLNRALLSNVNNNIHKFNNILVDELINSIVDHTLEERNMDRDVLDAEDIRLLHVLIKGKRVRTTSEDKIYPLLVFIRNNKLDEDLLGHILYSMNATMLRNKHLLFLDDTTDMEEYLKADLTLLLDSKLSNLVPAFRNSHENLLSVENRYAKLLLSRTQLVSEQIIDTLSKNKDEQLAVRHALTLAVMFQNDKFMTTKSRLLTGKETGTSVAERQANICMFPELLLLDKKYTLSDAVKHVYEVVTRNMYNVMDVKHSVTELKPIELPIGDVNEKCNYEGPISNLLIVPYADGRIFCFDRQEYDQLIANRKPNPLTGKPFPSVLYGDN